MASDRPFGFPDLPGDLIEHELLAQLDFPTLYALRRVSKYFASIVSLKGKTMEVFELKSRRRLYLPIESFLRTCAEKGYFTLMKESMNDLKSAIREMGAMHLDNVYIDLICDDRLDVIKALMETANRRGDLRGRFLEDAGRYASIDTLKELTSKFRLLFCCGSRLRRLVDSAAGAGRKDVLDLLVATYPERKIKPSDYAICLAASYGRLGVVKELVGSRHRKGKELLIEAQSFAVGARSDISDCEQNRLKNLAPLETALPILEYLYEKADGTIKPFLISEACDELHDQVVDWLILKGELPYAEDALIESVMAARIDEAHRWLEQFPSIRVPLSAVIQSVDFHATKHFICTDCKLTDDDIGDYFEKFNGSQRQIDVWHWFVESLGLVFDAKEWQQRFYRQADPPSVFCPRSTRCDINPSTWKFLISLGFTPTKEDFEKTMKRFSVAALEYLEQNFPEFIDPDQIPLALMTENLPLLKFYFRKFPQEAVDAVTSDTIKSFVDMQSVHMLDYLFEKAPQVFDMDGLFMASLSKLPTWSTDFSDFSEFQWLVDHGARLDVQMYFIALKNCLPSKWFLLLYDNKVKATQEVLHAWQRSAFYNGRGESSRETSGVRDILIAAMRL